MPRVPRHHLSHVGSLSGLSLMLENEEACIMASPVTFSKTHRKMRTIKHRYTVHHKLETLIRAPAALAAVKVLSLLKEPPQLPLRRTLLCTGAWVRMIAGAILFAKDQPPRFMATTHFENTMGQVLICLLPTERFVYMAALRTTDTAHKETHTTQGYQLLLKNA